MKFSPSQGLLQDSAEGRVRTYEGVSKSFRTES